MKSLLRAGLLCGHAVLALEAQATPGLSSETSAPPSTPRQPDWLLQPFLDIGAQEPERLLKIAEALFAPDRLNRSLTDPEMAFEWQHRLAMLSALTSFFEPEMQLKKGSGLRSRATVVLKRALAQDPGLLVRDGAVEAFRRLVRMRPEEGRGWQSALETAFLSPNNAPEGEGFFIRETILTAMRDASLKPTSRVLSAARADRNPQVRELLKLWQTNAFDSL